MSDPLRPLASTLLPVVLVVALMVALPVLPATSLAAQETRPMEIADLFRQASLGEVTLSPDGTRILYTLTPGSFPEPRGRDSQIHMALLDGSEDRAMTAREGGAHRNPQWHTSGELFGFTSTRDGGDRQLFLMRIDGGEPWSVSEVEGGIHAWGWSADGEHLAFLGGRGAERQIWIVDGAGREAPERLTDHPTPVRDFRWRESGAEILYTAPDDWDAADHRRREEGFRARPIQRGLVFDDFLTLYPAHLWRVTPAGGEPQQLTSGDFIVHAFLDSPRGDRMALEVGPVDPHADTRPREIHLLDPTSGALERLTRNQVSESILGFSPSGSHLAITAPRDFQGRGISDVYVRPVAMEAGAAGGGAPDEHWFAVTDAFDNDLFGGVWSADGESIYFVGTAGVNRHLYQAGVRDGEIRQLTDLEGVVSLAFAEAAGGAGASAGGGAEAPIILGFSTPEAPEDLYATRWDQVADRDRWTRLTEANPWVEEIQLARTETVRWSSEDGTQVEGLLVYPLNHDPDRRYPLITDIHGGPASAYTNSFLPTASNPHRAYSHLLAARGYAHFLPNYRGSSHYGHDFQVEIVGDYWTRATEDIHTGIDHLIERGIAHPDSLGMKGWSAGGHWSNWMLVTTDRFRAISTGAGVANWISLFAQTDNQASREWYLGGDASLDGENQPWHDFEHWWDESPLKYIREASTPTLIHFGQADQRIPMPQGQELHMALKKLGVPTEFLVYPEELHALVDPRNQLVKLMGELGWFERWIRGEGPWLEWERVLEVAEEVEQRMR